MRSAAVVALATSLLAAGCTASPTWTPVSLGGVRPSALATEGSALLVAGTVNGGPALVRLTADGVHSFTLVPEEPYAAEATLMAVSASATEVDAVGTVVGGAHGNPRWTAWDGTADPATITSRPQEFFTFGGHDAGPLLAVVQTSSGPVIVGSRTTSTGSRAVLYSRSGTTWSPEPSPEILTSTADVERGFSTATNAGDRIVIAGDELHLTGGLEQRPVVWSGADDAWQRVELPIAGITGSGLSRASSISCEGSACRVAGWVRGHPVVWTLDVDSATAGQPAVLAGDAPAGNDPRAIVATASGITVVATDAARPSLQAGCADGWRALASPGVVTALAPVDGRLYAISADRLWRLDGSPC